MVLFKKVIPAGPHPQYLRWLNTIRVHESTGSFPSDEPPGLLRRGKIVAIKAVIKKGCRTVSGKRAISPVNRVVGDDY